MEIREICSRAGQIEIPGAVLVAAYQWGRPDAPRVQSAGPVVQQFFIQK